MELLCDYLRSPESNVTRVFLGFMISFFHIFFHIAVTRGNGANSAPCWIFILGQVSSKHFLPPGRSGLYSFL